MTATKEKLGEVELGKGASDCDASVTKPWPNPQEALDQRHLTKESVLGSKDQVPVPAHACHWLGLLGKCDGWALSVTALLAAEWLVLS